MEPKVDIAIIGECLIELSSNGTLADTSTLNKYFGGDTVTTAVAIARLGGKVTYVTKVGNDGFSEFILSSLIFIFSCSEENPRFSFICSVSFFTVSVRRRKSSFCNKKSDSF